MRSIALAHGAGILLKILQAEIDVILTQKWFIKPTWWLLFHFTYTSYTTELTTSRKTFGKFCVLLPSAKGEGNLKGNLLMQWDTGIREAAGHCGHL